MRQKFFGILYHMINFEEIFALNDEEKLLLIENFG